MDDYMGTQFQLMPPNPPDYKLFMQQLEELGRKFREWCVRVWEGIKRAMQPVIDVFARVFSCLEEPPQGRHYARRQAWKAKHPIQPRKINMKRRMIAQHKMSIKHALHNRAMEVRRQIAMGETEEGGFAL